MGKRARLSDLGVMVSALRGLLFVFVILYINGMQGDFYQWNTYWPTTNAYHMFGPDWAWNSLVRAANPFKLAYLLFLVAFGIRIFVRKGFGDRINREEAK